MVWRAHAERMRESLFRAAISDAMASGIPAVEDAGGEVSDQILTGRIVCAIVQFVGVFFQVEELAGLVVVIIEFPFVLSNHALVHTFGGEGTATACSVLTKFGEGEVVPGCVFAAHKRQERTPRESGGVRDIAGRQSWWR